MVKDEGAKIFRPVGQYVRVFLDMTTYEQLKQRAASSKRTIAKEATNIITCEFEIEKSDKTTNK